MASTHADHPDDNLYLSYTHDAAGQSPNSPGIALLRMPAQVNGRTEQLIVARVDTQRATLRALYDP